MNGYIGTVRGSRSPDRPSLHLKVRTIDRIKERDRIKLNLSSDVVDKLSFILTEAQPLAFFAGNLLAKLILKYKFYSSS
jgi:hypothetical protein